MDEEGPHARTSGDFAQAFRDATNRRGLSLERLTYHLSRRGHYLSAATLSYWRTGRSVPQRSASIAALGALEEILGVERASLAALVPPRPGRRHGDAPPVPAAQYVKGGSFVSEAISALGLDWQNGLELLSSQDYITLRGDGTLDRQLVTRVLRASREGVDRMPVWYGLDDDRSYPFISAETNCRIGRIREATDMPLVVAELLLPRPMQVDDVIRIQFSYGAVGQTVPLRDCHRAHIAPCGECYLEVVFDPRALPVHAEEFVEFASSERCTPLPITSNALRRYKGDFGPGIWGLRWEWSEDGLEPISGATASQARCPRPADRAHRVFDSTRHGGPDPLRDTGSHGYDDPGARARSRTR
ncbi:MAG: hypothetical protein Q4P32_11795 [Micrococcales bacterium]|nr:hypothetical protein [Micrococcales bacterium]